MHESIPSGGLNPDVSMKSQFVLISKKTGRTCCCSKETSSAAGDGGIANKTKMEFAYDNGGVLDVEPASGEQFPEVSVIQRNYGKIDLLNKLSEYRMQLVERTDQRNEKAFAEMQTISMKRLLREGTSKVRETVYQTGNRMVVKLYLMHCGKRLHSVGKYRYSARFLEVAHAIAPKATMGYVQREIAYLLRDGYNNMGQYHTEPSVLSWEMDLFGTNDSKTVSCELVDGKLIAKKEFNVGDVIFIDKPVAGYVKDSKVQCNCCLVKTLYTMPCAECCAVFYCSMTCLQKDEHYHKYECSGLEMSYLTAIDGSPLVLRMFVNAMDIFKRNLLQRLQQPLVDSTLTPQQMWEILLEDHKHSEDFLKVFQACTCDHFAEDKATYGIMLQQVTLLMYYIVLDKQVMRDYIGCVMDFAENSAYRFMESVLLRLICVTKLNACSFRYDLKFDKAEADEMNIAGNQESTCEQSIILSNEYCGMYRFQTEMGASSTDFNTIYSLLDHGAVVFRAAKTIKKGDVLVFKVGSFRHPTSQSFVPTDGANPDQVYSFSSSIDSSVQELGTIQSSETMTVLMAELLRRELLCMEDNFFDLLMMFDCFLAQCKSGPATHERMVTLFTVINMLEALYHKATLIPLVLMNDDWMIMLMIRGVGLRLIRKDYNERLVNSLYNMYFQD